MRLYVVLDLLHDDVISVILSTLLLRIHQNRVAVWCCRPVRALKKSSGGDLKTYRYILCVNIMNTWTSQSVHTQVFSLKSGRLNVSLPRDTTVKVKVTVVVVWGAFPSPNIYICLSVDVLMFPSPLTFNQTYNVWTPAQISCFSFCSSTLCFSAQTLLERLVLLFWSSWAACTFCSGCRVQ